ncbi:hypothetical protein RJ640_014184 [Escallonia rubra]|uniref:Uncharacterized protein n=1 Tax=Escallonia rubra TaxID=112253 RepID=A0AA88QU31_9ASTE|nr:hypothetical protein RJ640_014184 [Escallonia rubra]
MNDITAKRNLLTVLEIRKPENKFQKLRKNDMTTVRPVSTVFLTVRITIAAALASSPDVGSSMKMIEGLATNSTAIVSLFLCSVDRPSTPGRPTSASLNGFNSTKSITSSTNI